MPRTQDNYNVWLSSFSEFLVGPSIGMPSEPQVDMGNDHPTKVKFAPHPIRESRTFGLREEGGEGVMQTDCILRIAVAGVIRLPHLGPLEGCHQVGETALEGGIVQKLGLIQHTNGMSQMLQRKFLIPLLSVRELYLFQRAGPIEELDQTGNFR